MDRACHLLHDGDTEDYSDSELSIENIYLHICHEEGQEFAGVTTFHGMIRIFTSRTWTSLIFWVLIVSTCLVFFMIFSGYILSSYAKANTFMRRYFETYNVQNASLSICGSPELANHRIDAIPALKSVYRKGDCLEIEAKLSKGRLSIDFRQDITTSSETMLLISAQTLDVHQPIYLRNRNHHRIFVEATQISRLNTSRVPCVSDFSELTWIQAPLASHLEFYTLQACEWMQVVEWLLREKHCVPAKALEQNLPVLPVCNDTSISLNRSLQTDFPCYAPCFSLHWKTTTSYSRTLRGLRITLEISNMMEVFVEVQKMAVTDVLSFIGGGTSLFLGCSCVTLMETFIFLLKLVLQSINKETYERIELENAPSKQEVIQSSTFKQRLSLDSQLTDQLLSGLEEEIRDEVTSIVMPSSPRKSTHFVRFLQSNSDKTIRNQFYENQKPLSSSELKSSSFFNEHDSPSIERSLKNLPLSQRLTFAGTADHRELKRQNAVEIADIMLEQYLNEPTFSRSFCDDFDRKYSARVKVRRISSGTSRGSVSTSRAKLHIVEHPRYRGPICNKFMAMNDF